MGFPVAMGIPWKSHGNGSKTQNWEWEGMGNHLSGNGNYLHSHGNLFPKVLCCDELIKLLVLQLKQNANVISIVMINDQDFCYQEHIIIITISLIIYNLSINRMGGNGNSPHGNPMGMGISQKLGNGGGREWELNRWEWEGMGMLKAIPAHLQLILPMHTGALHTYENSVSHTHTH